MKRILFLACILVGLIGTARGQSHGITYQALIVDQYASTNGQAEIPGVDIAGGMALVNQPLTVRFTIFDQYHDIDYQEQQEAHTDAFGMINLVIGAGQYNICNGPGAFTDIDWDGTPKSLMVEIKQPADEQFVTFDEQPLYFVPYAFHRNITATGTLTVDDLATLNNGLIVYGPMRLNGKVTVDSLEVRKHAEVRGRLKTHKQAEFSDSVNIKGQSLMWGNLTVRSETHLEGTLDVSQNTSLQDSLNVKGHSYMQGRLQVDQLTDLNDSLSVEKHSQLNATLTVAKHATLKDSLDVFGHSYLRGRLEADKATVLHDSVTVGGHSDFYGNLTVGQITSLLDSMYVRGAALLDNNLTVKKYTSLYDSLLVYAPGNIYGQLTVSTPTAGDENNYNDYPVRIEGSTQGVAIKINGSREINNNFVSFWDDGGMQGRIEGQTLSSLMQEPEYIYNTSMYTAQTIVQAASLAIAGVAIILDPGNFAIQTAQTVALAAEWIAYDVFAKQNLGVTYESGAGDYAEWLPRLNASEEISFGEIVGVFGGKISKVTDGAEQLMVVSLKPIVLGNMTPAGYEEKQCEMVAFMGQVPVRVKGPVKPGDYIVASESGSGLGIGIAPQDMTLDMARRVVGRAWTAKHMNDIGLVNVVVGVKMNEWVNTLTKQQNKIDELESAIQKLQAQQQEMSKLLERLLMKN